MPQAIKQPNLLHNSLTYEVLCDQTYWLNSPITVPRVMTRKKKQLSRSKRTNQKQDTINITPNKPKLIWCPDKKNLTPCFKNVTVISKRLYLRVAHSGIVICTLTHGVIWRQSTCCSGSVLIGLKSTLKDFTITSRPFWFHHLEDSGMKMKESAS